MEIDDDEQFKFALECESKCIITAATSSHSLSSMTTVTSENGLNSTIQKSSVTPTVSQFEGDAGDNRFETEQPVRTKSNQKVRHPGIGRPCPRCHRAKPYRDSRDLKVHLMRSCPAGRIEDKMLHDTIKHEIELICVLIPHNSLLPPQIL